MWQWLGIVNWIFKILQGNIALEKSKRQKVCPWIPDQGWEDMLHLSGIQSEKFGSLVEDIEKKVTKWTYSYSRFLLIYF